AGRFAWGSAPRRTGYATLLVAVAATASADSTPVAILSLVRGIVGTSSSLAPIRKTRSSCHRPTGYPRQAPRAPSTAGLVRLASAIISLPPRPSRGRPIQSRAAGGGCRPLAGRRLIHPGTPSRRDGRGRS